MRPTTWPPPSSSSTSGRVIAQGTPSELKSRVGADMVELHTIDVPTMQRAADGAGVARDGRAVHRSVDAPVLAGRARRLEAPARRRARARRRRGAGGGHRAAPPHPRRSVPRPHRAHHRPTRPLRRRTQHDHGPHPRSTAPGPTARRRHQPGRVVPRRHRPGGGAHPQEVRPLAGAAHRGHGAGAAVPAHLPLRVRRRGRPYRGPLLRGLPGAGLRRDRRAVPGHERGQRRGRRQGGRALRPAAQPAHPAALHRLGTGGRRHGARGVGRGRHDGGGLRRRLPRHAAPRPARWRHSA